MLPVILVVALNSGLFLHIVVSLCRQNVALHTTQTQGQRKRLQVSASIACFVVSGKVFYSCGLSTATIEYSLCVCVSVCLSVYMITQKKWINPLET